MKNGKNQVLPIKFNKDELRDCMKSLYNMAREQFRSADFLTTEEPPIVAVDLCANIFNLLVEKSAPEVKLVLSEYPNEQQNPYFFFQYHRNRTEGYEGSMRFKYTALLAFFKMLELPKNISVRDVPTKLLILQTVRSNELFKMYSPDMALHDVVREANMVMILAILQGLPHWSQVADRLIKEVLLDASAISDMKSMIQHIMQSEPITSSSTPVSAGRAFNASANHSSRNNSGLSELAKRAMRMTNCCVTVGLKGESCTTPNCTYSHSTSQFNKQWKDFDYFKKNKAAIQKYISSHGAGNAKPNNANGNRNYGGRGGRGTRGNGYRDNGYRGNNYRGNGHRGNNNRGRGGKGGQRHQNANPRSRGGFVRHAMQAQAQPQEDQYDSKYPEDDYDDYNDQYHEVEHVPEPYGEDFPSSSY